MSYCSCRAYNTLPQFNTKRVITASQMSARYVIFEHEIHHIVTIKKYNTMYDNYFATFLLNYNKDISSRNTSGTSTNIRTRS